MSKKKYKRNLSLNEKLYKVLENSYESLAIQIIVEGFGEIDINEFKKAVKKSCDYNPLCKCIYSNNKWVEDSKYPPIHHLNPFDFNGFDFSSDLFKRKIDHNNTSIAEIFIIHSKPTKILFRIFHGAMDGKGALIWIKNIFKILNNKIPIKTLSTENDLSILSKLPIKNKKNKIKFDKEILNIKNNTNKINTLRLSLEGKYIAIIPKITKILTEMFNDQNSLYLIPSDLRKYIKNLNTTSNLTFPFYLQCTKIDSWQDINDKLLDKLKQKEDLNLNLFNFKLLNKLSLNNLKLLIKALNLIKNLKNKYLISSIVSNLGTVDLYDFSTKKFKATNFYSIPVSQPFSPLSLVIVENQNTTEIVFSAYQKAIPLAQLNTICKKIEYFLSKKNIYKELNNNNFNIDPKLNIIDMFINTVFKYPQNIALSENNINLTYKELNQKSDVLADILLKKGLKKSTHIAVYLDRSIYLIIVILAIFKIGAIYIPIDTSAKFRINNILNDDNIKFIITNSSIKADVSSIKNKKILTIDSINLDLKVNFDNQNVNDNNILYQIYTSGSTGIPKGVQISNKAFKNYLFWAKNYYEIDDNNNFALFSSISVDFTLTSIFLPLINGGTLYIFKEFNHKILESMLINSNINSLKFTPTHLSLINSLNLKFNNKKLLIIGGEQLDTQLAYSIQKNCGQKCKIINEYGPTEATIGCIAYKFDYSNDFKYTNVPIGKPIFNTKILLLDNELISVKPNKIGEIYILGSPLAQGYYNDENITKNNFINLNGQIAYKTGDLAKLNHENNFIFIGRKDNQLKINGHRVEIEEIKYLIKQYKNINDVFINYTKWNTKIILKCYFTSSKIIDILKLKEFLKTKLANYMIPKYFIQIESFPIASNGKIDLKKLPKVNINNQFTVKTIDTNIDLTTNQKKLLDIWESILDLNKESIDINDNFFELGGDSLSLITMICAIEKKFYKTFNYFIFIKKLNFIYEDLTINNLAKIL